MKSSPYSSDHALAVPLVDQTWIPDADLSRSIWEQACRFAFETSYTPEITYPEARTRVYLLASVHYLHVFFVANYTRLNVYSNEDAEAPKWGLWDRDVVEVFLNPFPEQLRKYWEFEVAPNNLWIDLEIDLDREPVHKEGWRSNFEHATQIHPEARSWHCEMRIPVEAFNLKRIEPNSVWRANFYRCDGRGGDEVRRFLAWSPTFQKCFHVPERFGQLVLG